MGKKLKDWGLFCFILCLMCTIMKVPIHAADGPNADPTYSCAFIGIGTVNSEDSNAVDEMQYLYNVRQPESEITMQGVTYDKSTNTITLQDYDGKNKAIITNEMGDDLKVNVIGTNHIRQLYAYGYGYGGSVTLTGDGTLLINEDKASISPIYLDAEEANAKVTISKDLTIKMFTAQTNVTPLISVQYTAASEKGIFFENNDARNEKVEKSSVRSSNLIHKVYCLDKDTSLYPCTPKDNTDTEMYGALSYDYDVESNKMKYVIYKIVKDEELGILAEKAVDAAGNARSADEFIIDETEATMKATILNQFSLYSLVTYKRNDNPNDELGYACKMFSENYNGVDLGSFYSMYKIVQKDGKLFGVPVEGQQRVPKENKDILSLYTAMEGPERYFYSYYGTSEAESDRNESCVNGHDLETNIEKATDKKDGQIITKCATCNQIISIATISKISNIQLDKDCYIYNGKLQVPNVFIKDQMGKELTADSYEITYPKNATKVGKYSILVTLKGDYYAGNITEDFTIIPKGTAFTKLSLSKRKIVAKWKKQTSQTTGYQIQYATDSKFRKNVVTETINKNKTTTKVLAKTKAGKKYYVRIRTYKQIKVNNKNLKLYSSWGKVKSIKIN